MFTRGTISVLQDSPVALFANPFREGAEEFFVLDADPHLTYVHRAPAGDGWVQEEFDPGPRRRSRTSSRPSIRRDGVAVRLLRTPRRASSTPSGWTSTAPGTVCPPRPAVRRWNNLSVHYLPDRPATPCIVGVNDQRTRVQVLMPGSRHRGRPLLGDRPGRPHRRRRCRRCSTPACSWTEPSGSTPTTGRRSPSHLLGVVGGRRAVPGAAGGRLAGLWNAPDGSGLRLPRQ